MMPPGGDASSEVRVHRALASPVRERLLRVLREEPDLDSAALATRLDLHVNTVRSHLGVLEDAGLVAPTAQRREGPGRPRLLYRTVEQGTAADRADADGYRFLSSVLASYLAALVDDTEAAAERAGRAWGGFVVDAPTPFTDLDPEEGIERLVDMLARFGFDPELVDEDGAAELWLRRCPFHEVARDHQGVVCSIHLGLMRGALQQLGVDVQARDLLPWADPRGCVSHLEVAPSG